MSFVSQRADVFIGFGNNLFKMDHTACEYHMLAKRVSFVRCSSSIAITTLNRSAQIGFVQNDNT
jgi:hypothetical protein